MQRIPITRREGACGHPNGIGARLAPVSGRAPGAPGPFESLARRRRTRPVCTFARVFTLVVCVGVVTLGPGRAHAIWPFDRSEKPLDERAAAILSRAIRIPSTNPPGGEAALARYLVDLAEDAGLEARMVRTPRSAGATSEAEIEASDRAAGWARLRGTGEARPIVLLSHLDVVPAEPAEWSTPPFEGRIVGGRVIGRGALDAKGVAVVQLLALMELAKRDEPLRRDVIWLATPDEESGGLLGAGYLVDAHRELLGDAELLLTEGGNVRTGTPGSPDVWGVSVTEKSPCWLELTARGEPGHSSTPPPNPAVSRLIGALDSVRRIETPIRVLPEVQRMYAAMAPLAEPEDRAGYRDLRRALAEDARFRRRFLDNPGRNALVRDTISITVLVGAPSTNVTPAQARAHLDARLLPGESCADFSQAIANVVANSAVQVETLLSFDSRSSPIDTELFRAIERVATREDPGALVVPRVIAGFTDAHFFRDLGIVAYGFVPRWLSADDTRGIHGPDESVTIENLARGTRTLVAVVEELAAPVDELAAPVDELAAPVDELAAP